MIVCCDCVLVCYWICLVFVMIWIWLRGVFDLLRGFCCFDLSVLLVYDLQVVGFFYLLVVVVFAFSLCFNSVGLEFL